MSHFRLLGPVEIMVDGVAAEFDRRQHRDLLVLLLVHANRLLTVDQIVDEMWGGAAPATARAQVANMVSAVRRVLAASTATLTHRSGGYRLDVAADLVDLARFDALTGRARTAPPERAAPLLRAAVDLWRGPALTGVLAAYVTAARAALEERRLAAVEALHDAELRLGRHADLVPRLTEQVAAQPFRERPLAQLMIALYRSGRRAEALTAYRDARRRLADQHGLDPGAELRELETLILRADPALDAPAPTASPDPAAGPDPAGSAAPAEGAGPAEGANPADGAGPPGGPGAGPAARRVVIPRQLPAPARHFVGRATALKDVTRLVDDAVGGAVVIAAVAGTGGVGKTAMAVHWAHSVADRFPDGQLYANLRGFDPGGESTGPAEAVRAFLSALGVPPQRVPAGLDAQAALYRSLLAGRRMLVVLDNAHDSDQVRSLLPGTGGCLVLVTSRNRLTGLLADGAHHVGLDLLTDGEAHDLLARHLGPERIAADPGGADGIVAGCARLPLALAIVAARAAAQPTFPLAAFAAELSDVHQRLDALDTNDPTSRLRSAFSWSYRQVSEPAARLFRLVGLHPGPDISAPASASLTGTPPAATRRALAELTEANLLTEHTPGRYLVHDLLRAYASELAHSHESSAERGDASRRILDHYLHTAHTAAGLLHPYRTPLTLAPAQAGTTPESPADYGRALAWFAAEHRVMLTTVDYATASGLEVHTWQLAWTLSNYLDRQGHWHDWLAVQRAAVAATRRLADRPAQAQSERVLARIYTRLGHFEEAHAHAAHALDLYGEEGDEIDRAHTHLSLANSCAKLSRYDEAIEQTQMALDLYRAVGHPRGQANALNNVGWYLALRGDHRQALDPCERALVLHREVEDRLGEAASWHSLGYAHLHLGHHDRARTCLGHARDLFALGGDRHTEAIALDHLGDTYAATGDAEDARKAWREALHILQGLGHPQAERVRAKLLAVDS